LQAFFSDTAILLFSRSAAEEAMSKPLVVNAQAGQKQAVAAQFIRHARKVAAGSGLPIFVVSEQQQRGATFGARFADAFRQIFDRGFQYVIAIGNDCPSLTTADINIAALKLRSTSAVFGPAADGGAYLVGLQRDAFRPEAFAALTWQTRHTLSDLQDYAASDFFLLSEKSDVDSATDLQQLLHGHIFPVLLKIRLLNLLKSISPGKFEGQFIIPKAALLSGVALRGPPIQTGRLFQHAV